jgi:predicted nucleic acid-binding protein
MADYFFDTSALVKRHVAEAGTAWVKSLVRAKAGHTLYIARITAVEITSAITRRQFGKAQEQAMRAACPTRGVLETVSSRHPRERAQ